MKDVFAHTSKLQEMVFPSLDFREVDTFNSFLNYSGITRVDFSNIISCEKTDPSY